MGFAVKEHIVPVNGFDGFGSVVPERDFVLEIVTRRSLLMELLDNGRVSVGFAPDAINVGAAAAFCVVNAFFIASAGAHFVEILNRPAKRILLPANPLF